MARVLIVDDDPEFVRAAGAVLQSHGYRVSSATGAQEAWKLMQPERPDLVLLGEGLDLRDRTKDVPVIRVGVRPPSDNHDQFWLARSVQGEVILETVAEHVVRTAFIYSPRFDDYEYGEEHPLEPERARQTVELCGKYGLLDKPWVDVLEPEPAPPQKLALFHDWGYLAALKEANDGVFKANMIEFGLGTEDCPVFPGVYDYSVLVAGGTLLAAELLEKGTHDLAFNVAGGFHHAQRRNAEGFCYINDIVIAIKDLLRRGHRIAYVDIDAHHGDGVQSAFYEDDRVLTISLHESGKTLFPWSGFETEIGLGRGKGYNINVPLPPQTDDEVFLAAFDEIVPEAVTAFAPDFVFAQLGADSLLPDRLSHLALTNNGYADLVKTIEAISPRCVALGGGGYHMNSVTRAWCLAWAVMNGIEPEDDYVGAIGGMMLGTEYVEGGGLRDRHAYTTGPMKHEIRKEVQRVTDYVKETVFPLIKGPH
ncbi:MAG: acetoin utilization protein AcuC [Chloroflexi bacterium B3_Chlor]|nr:MAG: acetoin utilization protein AcuC [Chloroflexi bacterium B3_Chlor]